MADYSDLMAYQPVSKPAQADYSDLMAYKPAQAQTAPSQGRSLWDMAAGAAQKFGANMAQPVTSASDLLNQVGITNRSPIQKPLDTSPLATVLRVAGAASGPLLALGLPEAGLGSLLGRLVAPAAGSAVASEAVKPMVEKFQQAGHPALAAGTDLAANLAGGLGAGLLPGKGNLFNPEMLAKVKSGQEIPSLMERLKAGIGPEVPGAITKGNLSTDAAASIQGAEKVLGNNIDNVVDSANSIPGHLEKIGGAEGIRMAMVKSLESALGPEIFNPKSENAIVKAVKENLPVMEDLNGARTAVKNIGQTLEPLIQSGTVSAPQAYAANKAMRGAFEGLLPDSHLPSYKAANQAYSQLEGVKEGVQLSSQGGKAGLGSGVQEFDPNNFVNWWKSQGVKERGALGPELTQQLDQLTTGPKPLIPPTLKNLGIAGTAGLAGAAVGGHIPGVGYMAGPAAATYGAYKLFNKLQEPASQGFYQTKQLSPFLNQLLAGSRSASQLQDAMNMAHANQ